MASWSVVERRANISPVRQMSSAFATVTGRALDAHQVIPIARKTTARRALCIITVNQST